MENGGALGRLREIGAIKAEHLASVCLNEARLFCRLCVDSACS